MMISQPNEVIVTKNRHSYITTISNRILSRCIVVRSMQNLPTCNKKIIYIKVCNIGTNSSIGDIAENMQCSFGTSTKGCWVC